MCDNFFRCFRPGPTDEYYDFLAPSVFHLQTTLLEQIKTAGLDETTNLYQIEDLRSDTPGVIRSRGLDVSCPIDNKKGAAYVHCIDGDDHVGRATHMLSYAWGYRYGDIVSTLVDHCKEKALDPKKTYVWICCLCNNQHRVFGKNVTFEEFQSVFNKRVRGIGNILAMMAPWTKPTYLERVWCIFEMYTAKSFDCTVQIVMPASEKKSLVDAVLRPTNDEGKNGLDDLLAALANTKVELAKASVPEDKENILRLVEKGPGYYALNVEINQLMRAWVRNTVVEAVKDTESNTNEEDSDATKRATATKFSYCGSFFSRSGAYQDAIDLHHKSLEIYKGIEDDSEPVARCYNNIGTEYESMGNYEKALESHMKCLKIFERVYGKVHANTSVSYFNIGVVHRKLGDDVEGLVMFNKSLKIDEKLKGENHIDTAQSYKYIGRIMQANEDYDGALEMFTKTLSISEATYGKDHPATGIGYADVGLLYHMKGEYDEAIKLHTKAKVIQESILGHLHPDTAQVYQNIGGAYYEKEEFTKALELHQKAVAAFEDNLGKDHPKSVTAREWVSIVEEKIELAEQVVL